MRKFAIVVSQFNQDICDKLLEGAYQRLLEAGTDKKNIFIAKVPGAIEIPLIAKLLAKTNQYDAVISLGCIIRGETSHYDYVCKQISDGCQRVMLDHEIPIIFGVLTTETNAQAEERVGGKEGHKGREAAEAALTMTSLIKNLRSDQH